MAIVKNNFQMLDSMIRLWNLESVNRVISIGRTGIFPAEAQGFALLYVLDFLTFSRSSLVLLPHLLQS